MLTVQYIVVYDDTATDSDGATEIAGLDNDGPVWQGWTLQDAAKSSEVNFSGE